MVHLDDEIANLCIFNILFGHYKFIRNLYGLNCASEVIHRLMTDYFSDIDGVFLYVDDLNVHVYGKTK